MMTPSQYIKNQLKLWDQKFEGIHIRYAFDVEANFHMVEIDPEKIRRGNAEYKQQELDFWMNFMKLYPEENLLISEPSDINDMSNVIYSNMEDVCRYKYDVTTVYKDVSLYTYKPFVMPPVVRSVSTSMAERTYALAA
jgi:hypothetical protein